MRDDLGAEKAKDNTILIVEALTYVHLAKRVQSGKPEADIGLITLWKLNLIVAAGKDAVSSEPRGRDTEPQGDLALRMQVP
jgi:hypothetical protein